MEGARASRRGLPYVLWAKAARTGTGESQNMLSRGSRKAGASAPGWCRFRDKRLPSDQDDGKQSSPPATCRGAFVSTCPLSFSTARPIRNALQHHRHSPPTSAQAAAQPNEQSVPKRYAAPAGWRFWSGQSRSVTAISRSARMVPLRARRSPTRSPRMRCQHRVRPPSSISGPAQRTNPQRLTSAEGLSGPCLPPTRPPEC